MMKAVALVVAGLGLASGSMVAREMHGVHCPVSPDAKPVEWAGDLVWQNERYKEYHWGVSPCSKERTVCTRAFVSQAVKDEDKKWYCGFMLNGQRLVSAVPQADAWKLTYTGPLGLKVAEVYIDGFTVGETCAEVGEVRPDVILESKGFFSTLYTFRMKCLKVIKNTI